MAAWWNSLPLLTQAFYAAALLFGILFLWQLIMTVIGLGGGESELSSHVDDVTVHHDTGDSSETVAVFKLLSVRSVLAFFTLFTWAGALYLTNHMPPARAVPYALLWGIAAMLIVAFLLRALSRMAESGTASISSCLGATGTVYLDIPAGGDGEVRVMMSGAMTHLRARCAGAGLKAGAAVRVVKVTGPNSIEVVPAGTPDNSTKG